MRIALVHSFYSRSSPSGENQIVENQIEAIKMAGHEPHLVGVESDRRFGRRSEAISAAFGVASFTGISPGAALDEISPDLVYCHNLFPNYGYSWLKRWGRRTISTLHNYRPICSAATLTLGKEECRQCLDRGSLRALANRCYRGSIPATMPLAISTRGSGRHNPLFRLARLLLTLNEEAYATYSTVVPPDRLRLGPTLTIPVIDNGARSNGRYWLYLGRLTADKGLDLLLDVWPSDQPLLIAGSGPLEDRVRQAKEGNGNIEFLGMVSSRERGRLYKEALGLVVPSQWSEGLPTVIIEALSASCPVVLSSRISAAGKLAASGGAVLHNFSLGTQLLEKSLAEVISARRELAGAGFTNYQNNYSPSAWWKAMEILNAEVLNELTPR